MSMPQSCSGSSENTWSYFGEDRSVGMSILCREQSLNGFHLEQASYRVMQEERSMFWRVILMVTIRKKFI